MLPTRNVRDDGARENFAYLDDRNLIFDLGWCALVPAGAVPDAWAPAGTDVSREQYGDLFRKVGVANGAGDGSTTFGLPDPGPAPSASLQWIVRVK